MKVLWIASCLVGGLLILWIALLVAGDWQARQAYPVQRDQQGPVELDTTKLFKDAPKLPQAPEGDPKFWKGKHRDPFKKVK